MRKLQEALTTLEQYGLKVAPVIKTEPPKTTQVKARRILTPADKVRIRKLLRKDLTYQQISAQTGVGTGTIGKIYKAMKK